MAHGDPDDVLRSLRRYVWLMLGGSTADVNGDVWPVRTQRQRIQDDERPAAVVEESTPLTMPFARARTLSQGDVQNSQGYAVTCYPRLKADASDSRLEAGRVRSLLQAGFSRGLVTDDVPPVNIGAPFAFPIYDFAGVPVTGAHASRQGPTEAYQHAMLDRTFNVRAIQDPVDELRFTVVATMTATWWAPGRIGPHGPVARSMPDTSAVQ